jgi:hypothetical protein
MQAPKDPIPHVIIRTAESDHGLPLAMELGNREIDQLAHRGAGFERGETFVDLVEFELARDEVTGSALLAFKVSVAPSSRATSSFEGTVSDTGSPAHSGRSRCCRARPRPSNRHELLRSKAAVVNVMVKRRDVDHVRYG